MMCFKISTICWIETSIRRLVKTLWALGEYLAAIFGDADAMFELRA